MAGEETIQPEGGDSPLLPYDIVSLITDNEDLNGSLAYITKIPTFTDSSKRYILWYPGDPENKDDIPRLLTFRKGSQEEEITDVILRNRPDESSVVKIIRAETDRYLVGIPANNTQEQHVLRVIRVDNDGIMVVREGDLTETVVRIPVGAEGIGLSSPYVFLMPAEGRDADPREEPVTHSTAIRDDEIQRLRESAHVKILREELPEYMIREETLRIGGTRDTERLRGQIVAGITAIGRGEQMEHVAASERIKDLILKETRESIGDYKRTPNFDLDTPSLLRENQRTYPDWVIPIDGSRIDEYVPVVEGPPKKEGGPPTYKPADIMNPDSKLKNMPLQENVAALKDVYSLMKGDGIEVIKPTPYYVTPGARIFANKSIENATGPDGEYPVIRRAIPATTILDVPNGKDAIQVTAAEKIQPVGAVVLPIKGYVPDNISLIEGKRSWSQGYPDNEAIKVAPILSHPLSSVSSLIKQPVILDKTIARSIELIRENLSPHIKSVLKSLPNYKPDILIGGYDETEILLSIFGFNKRTITHPEEVILSKIINNTTSYVNELRNDMFSGKRSLRIPKPSALFRKRDELQLAYPETRGLIGPWEAFHRIINAPHDHGSLLYTINAINEYGKLREQMIESVKASADKRGKSRERMSEIKDRLHEIEGQLRTLDNVAKHYGSRKEVDADNKAAADGKVILWDNALDNDELHFLYSGERLRKIIGSLLLKLQDEGKLQSESAATESIDPTAEDICPTGERSSFGNISPDRLLEAVREDITLYNSGLPRENQMTREKMEEIVQRVILKGRPVKDGDVALITRHLRTAAYIWSDRRKRWVAKKDEPLKVQSNDITLKSAEITPEQIGTDSEEITDLPSRVKTVYSKTLELNKEYRLLSKQKDDIELANMRPSLTTNPEAMTRALDILLTRGDIAYETRKGYVKNNRILDESPFVHDMLDVMLRRRVGFDEQERDTGDRKFASSSDFRKALLKGELVVDTEQALFEAGLGSYEDVDMQLTEVSRTQEVGDIPESAIISDPRITEANRRDATGKDAVMFITEVKSKIDKIRRYTLLGIGMMETLIHVKLLPSEIAILITELNNLSEHHKGTFSDAIMNGIILCMLIVMTRSESAVILKTTEGIVPPPAKDQIPSYFYPPARSGDDERMLQFILQVLKKVVKNAPKKSDAKEKTDSLKTPVELLVDNSILTERDESKSLYELNKTATRISRGSPAIVYRSFRAQREQNQTRTYGSAIMTHILRRMGLWEDIPVGYHPSPQGDLIKYGRLLLSEETPLIKDPFGIPARSNAILKSPVIHPELKYSLTEMKRVRSDNMLKLLYTKNTSGNSSHIGKSILYSPSYEFIGVRRARIPETPLNRVEVSSFMKNIETSKLDDFTDITPIIDESDGKETLEDYVSNTIQELFEITYEYAQGDDDKKAIMTYLSLGNGKATLESGDANGSLRSELFSVHDAILMAIEDHYHSLRGLPKYVITPQNGGSYLKEAGPFYGIHNRVRKLLPGVNPETIENSPGFLAVINGEQTYYERVKTIINLLGTTLNMNTESQILMFRKLIRNIRITVESLPSKIPRQTVLRRILQEVYEYASSENEDQNVAANAYIMLYSHRYPRTTRRISRDNGVITDLIRMAADYTDVSPSMISEEANKDREMERQRFIYQLEGLDTEQRKITRALRLLGLDLAGKVARDPTRFNKEYYVQQSAIVAEQDMRTDESPPMGTDLDTSERTRQFGDAIDAQMMANADREAPEEVEQVMDVDYDE